MEPGTPYQKLREPPKRRCTGPINFIVWVRGAWHNGTAVAPMHSAGDVRVRVKRRLKEINLKLRFWENRLKKIASVAKDYLERGEEARAQAESRVYVHLRGAISTLLRVQTNLRLLVQEMDKVQTLSQCMIMLKDGTDALETQLGEAMRIEDIDHMMARWDIQFREAAEIGRAMAQPMAASVATDIATADSSALAFLSQWRLEALAPGGSPPEAIPNNNNDDEDVPVVTRDSKRKEAKLA